MNPLDQLSSLSDAALDSHVVRLAANERSSTVDVLWGLVALERRHHAAGLGFRVWTYCHERLQKPEGTASRYTAAAKLLGRFPAAEPLLRDGRLNPTTFTALEDVLTEANHQELFRRASGLSQKGIAILLAELQPKPDIEESMRFVPERTPRPPKPTSVVEVARQETPSPVAAEPPRSPDLFESALASAAEVERRHGLTVTATITTGDFTSLLPKDLPPPRCKAKLKPLRKGHFVLELNCDQQFADELEDLRMALTHVFPRADLGDAIREAVRRTLKDVLRRKYGLRSSKKVERREESVTSVAEVAPLEARDSLGTESRTSVAEVAPVDSRTSIVELEPVESTSSLGSELREKPCRTSAAEVAPAESRGPLAAETRTSVAEVTRDTGSIAPAHGHSTCPTSQASEFTVSTSITEVASRSPATATSTAEVPAGQAPRANEPPELSVPPLLFNRFFFQSDGDQFVPPWLRGVRTLSAELKRAVYERDGGCCAFVGSTGHRCSSRYRLEYDHWRPYARGGEATLDNIRLICRHHNVFCAFQTFGVELMSRYVPVH